eukprot:6186450-Pleurochrysis_carterae.AAC.6
MPPDARNPGVRVRARREQGRLNANTTKHAKAGLCPRSHTSLHNSDRVECLFQSPTFVRRTAISNERLRKPSRQCRSAVC